MGTQQWSNGQREVRGWEEGQRGETGSSVIESTITFFRKEKLAYEFMNPHLCFQQIKFVCFDQSHRAMFSWLMKAGIHFL